MLSSSCEKEKESDSTKQNTFIIFSLGFNNLSNALKSDIEDLVNETILSKETWKKNNLLIFSHHTSKSLDYTTLTKPVLTHIYRDKKNRVVRDTIMVLEPSTISVSPEVISTVLGYVHENFPAERSGMLISSHGTGWAPENYCNHPEQYDFTGGSGIWRTSSQNKITPAPLADGRPEVKSIGVHNVSRTEIIEMDIPDFVAAIPMKLDYIIFDACFMGCIEVAYELKDKCKRAVFSQTEILEDGMDYKTMLSYLFNASGPDLEGFCENYYRYYYNRTNAYQSATISLVDCEQLDPLATICKDIFQTHSYEISKLEGNKNVQRYYRSSYGFYHGWFYDLESIVLNSGASEEQIESFYEELDKCVLYKAATPEFMNSIEIVTHSGLSMYLPYRDRSYLNNFYKTLEWNKATSLVK